MDFYQVEWFYDNWIAYLSLIPKGQEISEGNCGVFNAPKKTNDQEQQEEQ